MNNELSNIPENPILVHSGADYFSRLERIISESQVEIHLQMYNFENDETGTRIIKALQEAAERNV